MELTRKKQSVRAGKPEIIFGLFGFVLGITPIVSGVLPFGLAFVCAVPKKYRVSAFVGALCAFPFDSCIPLYIFSAVYLLLVLNALEKKSKILVYHRALLALSVGALRAAYIAVGEAGGIDAVFRVIAAVIAYPLFATAFLGYFDKKKELFARRYDIALLSFAFALTMLVNRVEIKGVSLSFAVGAVFTLCAARSRGFGFSTVCGVLCGFASGGAATGALGVMGMTYGLLQSEIEPLALVLSFMLSSTGYYYLSDLPQTAVAIAMLSVVYIGFAPLRKKITPTKNAPPSAEKRAHDRRIARYAAAFSSLSSLFYTVSEKTRETSVSELNQGIVRVVDNFCEHCSGCELERSDISNFFTSEIRQCGVASYSKIPIHISGACKNACAMAREVNNLPILRQKEGENGLKNMADGYSAFSAILIDAEKRHESDAKPDKPLARALKNVLSDLGIDCDGVKINGERRREVTVFGVVPEKIKATPDEIASAVSQAVGTAVSSPEFVIHDDYVLMKMNTIPAIRIESAKISEAKNGETVCGDTVSTFENDDGYFYCLVSDGMGSGRDAALTSRLSAIMLEKLLSVGAEKESALKLLNKALVEKPEEVFATVDLLEIDRVRSRATLIKAGAAPTILIRNGKTRVIESRTPPAGIMRNVIADKKSFLLQKGDMIVMLSDGVLQTGSENNILPEKSLPPMPSARALASKLLRDARNSCESADDMSVCVLRIF